MELPIFEEYAGRNAIRFHVGNMVVWFSYKTPVAYKVRDEPRVVRENDWNVTTGRHLNAIDGGDKSARIDGATFEARLARLCQGAWSGAL